jgi:hypothetical protein
MSLHGSERQLCADQHSFCLAEGKKVLFVAEKLAALEVVKNRLSLAGLDPFVLELHSNKTNKKRVLEEISRWITFRPTHPNDLPRLQQQLVLNCVN